MTGLLRNLSGIDLYWFATKLQLPLKSFTEEFKVKKVRPYRIAEGREGTESLVNRNQDKS